MAKVNLTTGKNAFQGGSSALDFGLTAAQAQSVLADEAAVIAWYLLSRLEGGEMGENVEVSEVKDESGEIVTVFSRDQEFEIGQTSLLTDDQTMLVLDNLAESGDFYPARYPLPAGVDVDGNELHQLWYFPNAKVVKQQWRMAVANNETRKRPFTVKAYRRNGDPLYVVATVRLDDQDNWPAALADAKDSVFAAA